MSRLLVPVRFRVCVMVGCILSPSLILHPTYLLSFNVQWDAAGGPKLIAVHQSHPLQSHAHSATHTCARVHTHLLGRDVQGRAASGPELVAVGPRRQQRPHNGFVVLLHRDVQQLLQRSDRGVPPSGGHAVLQCS